MHRTQKLKHINQKPIRKKRGLSLEMASVHRYTSKYMSFSPTADSNHSSIKYKYINIITCLSHPAFITPSTLTTLCVIVITFLLLMHALISLPLFLHSVACGHSECVCTTNGQRPEPIVNNSDSREQPDIRHGLHMRNEVGRNVVRGSAA